jgi:hypothetical protein
MPSLLFYQRHLILGLATKSENLNKKSIGKLVSCRSEWKERPNKFVGNKQHNLETELPMQDFPWVPYVDLWHSKHWENLHRFSTQWFRPGPLCCKQHDQHKPHISNLEMLGLTDVPLEHVIEVNLQCQVSLSEYNKRRTMLSEYESSLQDCPQLNVGLAFTPHDSSKDMLPADKSSAIASIDGQEQNCLHTNITLK